MTEYRIGDIITVLCMRTSWAGLPVEWRPVVGPPHGRRPTTTNPAALPRRRPLSPQRAPWLDAPFNCRANPARLPHSAECRMADGPQRARVHRGITGGAGRRQLMASLVEAARVASVASATFSAEVAGATPRAPVRRRPRGERPLPHWGFDLTTLPANADGHRYALCTGCAGTATVALYLVQSRWR